MHQFNKISITLCSLLIFCYIIDYGAACNCPAGICCSKWGYCSLGGSYCGDGCQAGPCSSGSGRSNVVKPSGSGSGRSKVVQPSGSYSGRCKHYDVNVGYTVCGTRHSDDEYVVVAMNAAQFDPHTPNGNPNLNSLCNRRIQVNGPRGSVEVTVVDRCAGCPYGGLDLSPAAFIAIAGNLYVGVVQASWYWK